MARAPRVDVGGYEYHVLNRTAGRWRMFRKDSDFEAFERVLEQAVERSGGDVKLLTYCLMGNHWHLVLKTQADGVLGPFMQWLTTTHAGRYRVAHRSVGSGSLYQGRYKSFLIQSDAHLLTACRYVERNAARAGLVKRAEDWRWSGLWRWKFGPLPSSDEGPQVPISGWPVVGVNKGARGRPRNWLRTVNTPLSEAELADLRTSANRCSPYGKERWRDWVVREFGLESTVRKPGRPKTDV